MSVISIKDVLRKCEGTSQFYGKSVVDVNQRGIDGDTPLHLASLWGDVEAVEVLLGAGANLNAKGDRGQTPLFSAVMGENSDVVRRLLAAGANLHDKDSDGRTVLQFAESLERANALKAKDVIPLLRG